MEFTQSRTIKITAILLLLTALSQPVYTALYISAPEVDRQILWGLEGLIFTLLVAFAGSALVLNKRYSLVFAAIAFSAVLNIVQVGIGVTQFGPFGAVARANAELSGLAGGVVGLSFFVYNTAKILLGLAALAFGMSKMKDGGKALGGLTALAGLVAFATNALVIVLDLHGTPVSRVAGASGVVATLFLAICVFGIKSDD